MIYDNHNSAENQRHCEQRLLAGVGRHKYTGNCRSYYTHLQCFGISDNQNALCYVGLRPIGSVTNWTPSGYTLLLIPRVSSMHDNLFTNVQVKLQCNPFLLLVAGRHWHGWQWYVIMKNTTRLIAHKKNETQKEPYSESYCIGRWLISSLRFLMVQLGRNISFSWIPAARQKYTIFRLSLAMRQPRALSHKLWSVNSLENKTIYQVFIHIHMGYSLFWWPHDGPTRRQGKNAEQERR